MPTQDLQRTAYTVECFLNALRLEDSAERTELEEALVRWLADTARLNGDHLIYQKGQVSCYSRGRVVKSYPVPQARQMQTLWCNRAKLSAINGAAFSSGGKLVLLGTAGLMLGMPGAMAANVPREKQRSSNNNNNNNNNNGYPVSQTIKKELRLP